MPDATPAQRLTNPAASAVMIGAGPAGLTAAFELVTRTEIKPILLERDTIVGGISRTVKYKGNRIDIGGHRFFSKSDRVMRWWAERLPMERFDAEELRIAYQGKDHTVSADGDGPSPEETDDLMLVRPRKSRIYYLRKFFDYPISLSTQTVKNLGPARMVKIGMSYLLARMFPIRNEKNLEQFFINRFGRELYLTFFKSYTEKVWGVPCEEISAAWGAQRIKGLSITRALGHALSKVFGRKRPTTDISQKSTETSLVERFLYPKFGPGQMWEKTADEVTSRGGDIHFQQDVVRILTEGRRVTGVVTQDRETAEERAWHGDYFFSTMPVKDLVAAIDGDVPANVLDVASRLQYRDFLTVGLLVKNLKISDSHQEVGKLIRDNWIYIQEPDVLVGRLQIFNNWSPFLVADPDNTVWLGMEYFCNEGDELWIRSDDDLKTLAKEELTKIGIIDADVVLDATVLKMPKTYPAYFGAYERFDEVRSFLDEYENLFLIGRNGMHRYNNQDHSMLTAMTAVDNIIAGRTDKANLWSVNTEQEYHEAKADEHSPTAADKNGIQALTANRIGPALSALPVRASALEDGQRNNDQPTIPHRAAG